MMKKLLLTTALVSMSAAAAFADGYTPMAKDFDVKLGGEFDFQAGFRSQKNDYTHTHTGTGTDRNEIGVTANNKSVGFDTTADLYLDARNTTAQGMTYGAHIGLQTTTASNRNINNKHNNTSFLFMEHKDMGRLEAGSNTDAANAMSVLGSSNASATGGVAGDWWKYVVLSGSTGATPATADANQFLLSPEVSMDNNAITTTVTSAGKIVIDQNTEKSRKVSYYTPKFNGFQAGLSYAPDVENKGSRATLPVDSTTGLANQGLENAISAGFSWEGKVQKDHALKASLTGVFADSKNLNAITPAVKLEDTKVISVGGMYTFQDMVSLALSYTDYDKTGLLDDKDSTLKTKKGHAFTGGLAVAMDKFTVSLTGMMSEKNKNKAKMYSLGADYKMAPGLMPYAEITNFDMKQNRTQADTGVVTSEGTALKNKGTAFILGTKVKF